MAQVQTLFIYLKIESFYNHIEDKIYLPLRKQFPDAVNFFNVTAHELGHWSGHSTRLDRPYGNNFGDQIYAFEEIVSEINAAFFMCYFRIQKTKLLIMLTI